MAPKRNNVKSTIGPRNLQNAINRAFIRRLEHKSNITSVPPTLVSSSGTVQSLSINVIQGTDKNQRSGDTITSIGDSLNFRFRAITTDQTCRFILFRDNMNTGVTPGVSDVLETPLYRSEYNSTTVVQQKRFTILLDMALDSNLSGETLKTKMCNIRPHGKTFYNGSAAVATSNGKGAIFLLIIGDTATGLWEYTYQQRFTDA